MPYQYPSSIPNYIKNLPTGAQKLFIRVFNEVLKETDDEDKARMAGWGAVKNKYKKVRDKWVPKVSTAKTTLLKCVLNLGGTEVAKNSIVSYDAHTKAPDETTWDADAEQKIGWDKGIAHYKAMHTWFNGDEPDNKGSYHLPHHRGENLATVWNGVKAAGGAVMGARGADIPSDVKEGIKSHLEKHYHQFDKKAPWEEESKTKNKGIARISIVEAKETLRKFIRGSIFDTTDDSIDLGEKPYPQTKSSEPWYPSINISIKEHLLGNLPVGTVVNVGIEAEIGSISIERDQKIISLKLKKLTLKNVGQES